MELNKEIQQIILDAMHLAKDNEWDAEEIKTRSIYDTFRIQNIINSTIPVSSLTLPTSTQLISDCRTRFESFEGRNKFDYRSYLNGYLDSFSKYVISKKK